jgi:hypothetical protein
MIESVDEASKILEKMKRERNQIPVPKVTSSYEVAEDIPLNPLSHLESLTSCCPDARNREKVEDAIRQKNVLNDFVLSMIDQYPENVRTRILNEVKKTMTF